MKKSCAAVFSIVFSALYPALSVFAEASIVEIMYDVEGTDTGREWIEVRNDGDRAVDLSGYRLFESGSAHKIAAHGPDSQLAPGGFAVIADVPDKFLADNPGFSGLLFDSAFSLSNDGEALSLRNPEEGTDDEVSYSSDWGAKNDGRSLQRTEAGIWVSANPTPGSATIATESDPVEVEAGSDSDKDEEGSQSSAHSSQAPSSNGPDKARLEVAAGRSRLGSVGSPIRFSAQVLVPGSSTSSIRHAWSLGDGSFYSGALVSHVYRQPGRYSVVLNSKMSGVEAVSRTSVVIREPVASIVEANDSFIELRNADDFELNVGGWRVEHETMGYEIPLDTIVAARSSLRLPSEVTGLYNVVSYARLVDPSRKEVSRLDLPDEDDPLIGTPPGTTPASIRSLFFESIYGNDAK